MRFPDKHIADTVVERIMAAAAGRKQPAKQGQELSVPSNVVKILPDGAKAIATFPKGGAPQQEMAEIEIPTLAESGADPGTVLQGGDMLDAMLKT